MYVLRNKSSSDTCYSNVASSKTTEVLQDMVLLDSQTDSVTWDMSEEGELVTEVNNELYMIELVPLI